MMLLSVPKDGKVQKKKNTSISNDERKEKRWKKKGVRELILLPNIKVKIVKVQETRRKYTNKKWNEQTET